MKRALVYCRDLGLYRKEYIATMEDAEFAAVNALKDHMAVELDESDWYGHSQPDTIR
jgi:hypothetical protein